MIIKRLLEIMLVILGIVYIILEIFRIDLCSKVVSATLLVMLTVLYIRTNDTKKKKIPYFLYFLITFAVAELLTLSAHFINLTLDGVNYNYYVSNLLYMLAYTFLVLRCLSVMEFKEILKKFPVTLIILIMLSVFCVTLITETAQSQLSTGEYIIEFVYNGIVMVLLSTALIAYMDKGDNKSMLFLIGAMFIFFSEMIQLAYYYVAELQHLAAIYSSFLVLAFLFFYLQSKLKHQKKEDFGFLNSNIHY